MTPPCDAAMWHPHVTPRIDPGKVGYVLPPMPFHNPLSGSTLGRHQLNPLLDPAYLPRPMDQPA